MLNLKRKLTSVSAEARVNPRIEFHYPVSILGIDANARIVDFSLGGLYIESECSMQILNNQKVSLILRLPEEKAGVIAKAQIIYRDQHGFGCKFCDIQPNVLKVLSSYFNMFSGILPIE
jgi:hypothetical protein